MARLYSPEEVVRRLKLKSPPCLGSLDESLREYGMFVTEHAALMKQVREKIMKKRHKRFGLAYIQW